MSSDGVGRTGTFICLHSQLERLKTEGVVDFFQAVKSARIQRVGLVPDAVCSSPLSFCVSLLSHPLSRSHLASFSLSHILSQLGVLIYSHYPSLLLSPGLPSISLFTFSFYTFFFHVFSQAHYVFCHEVVATYVDSFETYANFKEVV